MQNPWVIVALSVGGTVVVGFVIAFLMSGGDMNRVKTALRCKFRALRDAEFVEKVQPLLEPPPDDDKLSGVPLRMLAILQRKGRLVDFLLEEINEYSDEQIGMSVRDIHEKCQKALKEHLKMEPVLGKNEGDTVEVSSGFDPSAIQVTGNVAGDPPYKGELQHHGWRVTEIKIAEPPEGVDELVLQPAEVEVPE